VKAKVNPGMCPTLRHIRREHSSLNIFTGEVSGVEKVTWATEACSSPLFGNDREAGICSSCAKGWQVPGSRLASQVTLEQAQAEYASGVAA
jgi:hypothetical protein